MERSYLAEVLKFALRGFVLRTDAMQILIASVLPALFRLLGIPLPEDTQAATLAYIGYVAAAFFLIRFLTAPYFIWKQQNSTIDQLNEKISEPLLIQQRLSVEHTTKEKLALSSLIGKLTSFALSYGTPNKTADFWDGVQVDIDRAREIAEQFSYDEGLWNLCNDTIQLITIIISDKTEHRRDDDARKVLNENSKKLLKLLQAS